jgi:aspartyl-tRNA synthetase
LETKALKTEPMGNLRRTHTCDELRSENDGQTVTLMGWVHRRRDLGGLIFIDLRDRYGMTQVVIDPAQTQAFEKAERVRSEFVLAVTGTVRIRPGETRNENIATGDVELVVQEIKLLNTAKLSPVQVSDYQNVDEALRLQYRYVDLRRPSMANHLILRHKMAKAIRDYLDSQNFLEIETPTLVSSTPEGARDYLVPSRVHPGSFYALPQSPQIFKQLLMVSGMDRYFQIARCYRDEDLRADRQPEFTQIDMEMSFVGQDDVLTVVEGMLEHVFRTVMDVQLQTPFLRMPYHEAAELYGSDKPDLRYDLRLHNVEAFLQETEFKVFKSALESGQSIRAMVLPGQATASRKVQGELDEIAKAFGLGGLFFVGRNEEGGLKSSILKHVGEDKLAQMLEVIGGGPDDLVMLSAGPLKELQSGLGKLRVELAKKYDLAAKGEYSFHWVVDFPLFAYNEEEKALEPEHHPFTSPHPDDFHLLDDEPLKARAAAYDLVLNGNETASGSVRIFQRELQEKLLGCIGLTIEDARAKFGFLLDAFEYGAPPHAGIALGFDRVVAVCAGQESIREVIAFPKNANAYCPMTAAPVIPSQDQLDILHLKVEHPKGE